MKASRWWQRIFILSLLALSVLAPVILVSYRLKTLSSTGWSEFIEDLNSIKRRTDDLKQSAVELEAEEGLREPALVLYKDGVVKSVASDTSSNQIPKSENSVSAKGINNLVNKNVPGTNEDKSRNQHSLSASEEKGQYNLMKVPLEQSNQTAAQRGHNVRSQPRRATDEMVMQMKDQLAKAKMFLQFSPPSTTSHTVRELRQRIKDVDRALGEATRDSELSRSAQRTMRAMEITLAKARRVHPNCSTMATKLRAMAYKSEEQVRAHKNQLAHLVQLAARTTAKGLHCLSMRLTADYFALVPEERKLPNQHKWLDPDLHHFAVFSDNVLACAVVVNSTVSNIMGPEKVVFHIVTDSMNLPAISLWFLLNPPGEATVQIHSMDDFKWLSDHHNSRLKKPIYRDPESTSRFDHLRFYLPDIFPALNKVVLLDHDVVVQGNLAGLWGVEMKGKVLGVVETCQEGGSSFRGQMDMINNFSDPIMAKMVDAKDCTWDFGMNVFDLRVWRKRNLTAVYHKYLHLGLERPLVKTRRLPLGRITFYNETVSLDTRWHALGLGYDSRVERRDIKRATAIQFIGVTKPWLDIGVHKEYWSKFVYYGHPYLQQCNIHW